MLTARSIKSAKPGRHADGHGLYLYVSDSGAKCWVLRVQVRGRRRDIGLGAASVFSLAEARERCAAIRKAAKLGLDPITERDKNHAHVPTFEEAAILCHEARKLGWAPRHADAFLSSLRQHAFPRLGRLLVSSVNEREIVNVLAPLWHERPSAARKLRQRISTVLDFAKGYGWRVSGAPRETLRPLLASQKKPGNFAAMPYDEVPEFVARLRAKAPTQGRMALLFTILTAARSGEVRLARWSHMDFNRRLWTRPANLMKNGEQHVVTLSNAAIALLREAEALRTRVDNSLIFPGLRGRQMSDMTLLKLLKTDYPWFTVHGFRSSFRTWAAERMPSIPQPVAEAALAHVVPDQVERAYQRSKFIEMRRELLEAWSSFLGMN